jgi:hypothetical protein
MINDEKCEFIEPMDLIERGLSIDIECGVVGCGQIAIGNQTIQEFWGSYVTYNVCEEHAFPVLRSCKSGESGHGINISWKRY